MESVEANLEAMGEDPEAVKQRGIAFVKKLKGQRRLHLAQARRKQEQERLNTLRERIRSQLQALPESFPEVLERLAGRNEGLSLAFRKLEEANEKDMLNILEDVELLKLLDELLDEDEDIQLDQP
jgi:hypothetical protein